MEDRLRELNERLASERGGRTGRGLRYSAALRHEVVGAAGEAKAGGLAVGTIARQLGVRPRTLHRWLGAGEGEGRFRLVRLRRVKDADGVAIVSPAGFRVEGLDLGAAATLLRLLG